MEDADRRQEQMQTDVLLIATAAASLLNGMPSSPVLLPFVALMKPLLLGTWFSSPIVLTYLASIMASATTLVLAGVPAALYERVRGLERSNAVSLGIWLGCTLLLTLPALISMASRN